MGKMKVPHVCCDCGGYVMIPEADRCGGCRDRAGWTGRYGEWVVIPQAPALEVWVRKSSENLS